jgi:hypothetical protein
VPDLVVEGEPLTFDGRKVRMRSDDGKIFEVQVVEGVQICDQSDLGAQMSEGLSVGERVRAALVPTPDGSGQMLLSLGPAN